MPTQFFNIPRTIEEYLKSIVNPASQDSLSHDSVSHTDSPDYLNSLRIKAANLIIAGMPTLSKTMGTAIAALIIMGLTGIFFEIALIGLAVVYVIGMLNETFKESLKHVLNWLQLSPTLIIIGFPILAILSFIASPMTLLLVAGALMLVNHFILPKLEAWAKASAQSVVSTPSEVIEQQDIVSLGAASDDQHPPSKEGYFSCKVANEMVSDASSNLGNIPPSLAR